jgi:4-carboxymuconolactone decarboxylase
MTDEPRILPVVAAERDAATEELLTMVGDLADLNFFATMVRHPRLFKRWVPYGAVLLRGSLPAHDRELLILRTAHHCACDYEWGHHEVIAADGGFSAEQIAGVREGPDWSGWSPFERALLRAADELHEEQRISDATWATLAGQYDERLLIEVPMLVGHYHSVAFTLNSLRVQLEAQYQWQTKTIHGDLTR